MPDGAPPVLGLVAAQVERRLRVMLDEQRARWVALDADLEGPFTEIGRFVVSGGKRLRRRSAGRASSAPAVMLTIRR